MSTLYRGMFNIPQMVVAQKRRSYTRSSTCTKVEFFSRLRGNPAGTSPLFSQEACALRLSLTAVLESDQESVLRTRKTRNSFDMN